RSPAARTNVLIGQRPDRPAARLAARPEETSMRRFRKALIADAVALVLFLLTGPVAFANPSMEVQRVTSPGGIEAWLVEDHSNPILSIAFGFRVGTADDPDGKEGLAEM